MQLLQPRYLNVSLLLFISHLIYIYVYLYVYY